MSSKSMIRIDLSKARYAQIRLSKMVVEEDLFRKPIKYVGGVDVAFKKGYAIGAAVVIEYKELSLVDKAYHICPVKVPYIPTYLAFREICAMIGAVKKLKITPDIILVDAHGKLHPRKAGEATHLGVTLNIPTIGVAKSHLVGEVRDDNYVVYRGEILGYKLQTGIYVSVGHRVTLETAIKIVRELSIYNMPEPTRQAHIYANELRRRIDNIKLESKGLLKFW